jgi:hypothetical protein
MVGLGFGITQALGLAGPFASGVMSAEARQGEFAEQLRRLRLKKEQTVGLARSRANASGVTADSATTDLYLKALTGEFDFNIRRLEETAGQVSMADTIGNFASLFGGGVSTLGGIAKANNWQF